MKLTEETPGMRPRWLRAVLVVASACASLLLLTEVSAEGRENVLRTPNPSGVLGTVSVRDAVIDPGNPFFQALGTNGRACSTCHVPDQAWSISPPDVRRRFAETGGTDPLFRVNDGANAPTADVSTVDGRHRAYSMLLTKGLIRVGIGIPDTAEFELIGVDDPYNFASASELSLFRRPLPSTNLTFLSAVMWDGRDSTTRPITFADPGALVADLRDQADAATVGHAQAAEPLTPGQRQQIVEFELALFTAQVRDQRAGSLQEDGGRGGPVDLVRQPFHIGINDDLGPDPLGGAFDPRAMTLFRDLQAGDSPERQAIRRGEALFNTRSFTIADIGGLNSPSGPAPARLQGTCTTCHNTPNVGNHSVPLPLDLGLADAARRTPDMPLYTLRNRSTGEVRQTTDPGRALVTGRWADIGKFKGPILRGLAARAPYFHNGAAASLAEVVTFYNGRFAIGLTAREQADLAAFLRAL